MELRDNESYDVRTSGAASLRDGHSYSETGHRTSDDGAEKLAIGKSEILDKLSRDDALLNIKAERCQEYGIYSLDSERRSYNEQRDQQQQSVNHEIGITHLYPSGELDDGAYTGHSTSKHIVRSEKYGPSTSVDDDTQRD